MIFHQESQRVVGHLGDEGRVEAQAGKIGGHVALRPADVQVQRPCPAKPLEARRRQSQHALAYRYYVVHLKRLSTYVVFQKTAAKFYRRRRARLRRVHDRRISTRPYSISDPVGDPFGLVILGDCHDELVHQLGPGGFHFAAR